MQQYLAVKHVCTKREKAEKNTTVNRTLKGICSFSEQSKQEMLITLQ